jgi:hypothetical protein
VQSSKCASIGVVAISIVIAAASVGLALQTAPAQNPGRARGAEGPPPNQPGHGTGKLVLWGDLADFTRPGTSPRCYATSRFKRGQRAGFRMTAIDGGTGETEFSAEMVIHLHYGGRTLDIPTRWRGVGGFPIAEYPAGQPTQQWTGVWEIPADAMIGTFEYTVTAKDKFGRTATFNPFPNHLTQFTIVE